MASRALGCPFLFVWNALPAIPANGTRRTQSLAKRSLPYGIQNRGTDWGFWGTHLVPRWRWELH